MFASMNEDRKFQRLWKPLAHSELDFFKKRSILWYSFIYWSSSRWHRRLRTLWDKVTCHALLRAVTSFTRFEMINTFLRFDDSITRREQAATERYILQPVQIPIDEIHMNSFQQCMTSKPAKYALTSSWITAGDFSYPLRFAIYTGSSKGTDGLGRGYDVVMYLIGLFLNVGRNLTVEFFFTSVDLALKPIEKRTTLMGTMEKKPEPKPFVTKEELDENGHIAKRNNRKVYRPLYSSVFGFSRKMVSYDPQPNKVVPILSTQHNC